MLSHHLVKPHVGLFYWTDRGYIALCLQNDAQNPMFSIFKPENTAECVWEMYTELPSYSMFGKLEKLMLFSEVDGWVEVLQQDLYGRSTVPLKNQLQMQHSFAPSVQNVNVTINVSIRDTPKPMWREMSDYWEDRGFGDD